MVKYIYLISFLTAYGITGYSQTPFTPAENKIILSGDTTRPMYMPRFSEPAGQKALRTRSSDVDLHDPLLPVLAHRMYLTVTDTAHAGVGIAAPQTGINRNLIWVQRFDKAGDPFECFVNPKILWKSQLVRLGAEGDLSFDERGDVYRSYVIQADYYTLNGVHKTEMIEGFTAVIYQHETDHLKGTILTDRITEQKKATYKPVGDQIKLYVPELPKR